MEIFYYGDLNDQVWVDFRELEIMHTKEIVVIWRLVDKQWRSSEERKWK